MKYLYNILLTLFGKCWLITFTSTDSKTYKVELFRYFSAWKMFKYADERCSELNEKYEKDNYKWAIKDIKRI